ncbi:MAG TPA: hypothetical protein PKX87_01170 [Alphaproteobacteria bacterium]|nr:hypothetical protein [Alphaproteobacteria bacterium]
MSIKASNLVAVFSAVALGAAFLSIYQCSAKQDIKDALENSQKSHNARLECALNPESCKPNQ